LLAPAVARAEPAARVADAVEHAATSAEPRTRYVVGREGWLRLRIATLLPDRVRDRLMLSLIRRYQEAPQ
jgi:hypothetical protein